MSDIPILGQRAEPQRTIEVCRSFARKLSLQNYGGQQYESADFFASRKIECAEDAAGWVSQQIYEECVAEVQEAMATYIKEMKQRSKERKTA